MNDLRWRLDLGTAALMRALEGDKGGGAGGSAGGEGGGAGGEGAGGDGGKGGTPPGGKPNGGDEPKFTQAQLDAIIADRLAREKARTEASEKKAREEAEAAALAEQQKFKELADQRQGKIAELEGKVAELEQVRARADKFEAALKAQLEGLRKGLPPHILELLDSKDPADQLTWLAKNQEQLGGGNGRVPATPRANGQSADQKVDAAYERMKQAGVGRKF